MSDTEPSSTCPECGGPYSYGRPWCNKDGSMYDADDFYQPEEE